MFATEHILPPIVLRRRDFLRLNRLIASFDGDKMPSAVVYLEREIMRAEVMDDGKLPDDAVAIASQVTYRDTASGERRTVMLVYPEEADIAQDKVSVLSPIGAALIGMRTGRDIIWYTPDGREQSLLVMAVK